MKRYILILLAISLCLPLSAQWREDILGDDFQQLTMQSGSGECATLVACVPLLDSGRAVLYVHGYNDYFFQAGMAQQFRNRGYNFYAVDLRGYGRSMVEEQTPFQVAELSDYFEDIDSALSIMSGEGVESVVLMGHSTGGLTLSLYADNKEHNPMVEALVLNSPFFDMNLGWFVEKMVVPVMSTLGGRFPTIATSSSEKIGAYAQSLLSRYHGEWEYDESMKFSTSLPISSMWIRAIHHGHKELHGGLNIPYPTLVMHSDNTVNGNNWTPEHQSGDSVLDVRDIAKYAPGVGKDVTVVEIKGALHDIVLSEESVRNHAYQVIFDWLDSAVTR
ncbi:MAG: alpha/beta hydrolase [Rikenellaceae bacterium]